MSNQGRNIIPEIKLKGRRVVKDSLQTISKFKERELRLRKDIQKKESMKTTKFWTGICTSPFAIIPFVSPFIPIATDKIIGWIYDPDDKTLQPDILKKFVMDSIKPLLILINELLDMIEENSTQIENHFAQSENAEQFKEIFTIVKEMRAELESVQKPSKSSGVSINYNKWMSILLSGINVCRHLTGARAARLLGENVKLLPSFRFVSVVLHLIIVALDVNQLACKIDENKNSLIMILDTIKSLEDTNKKIETIIKELERM
jgi:hypothetical protein